MNRFSPSLVLIGDSFGWVMAEATLDEEVSRETAFSHLRPVDHGSLPVGSRVSPDTATRFVAAAERLAKRAEAVVDASLLHLKRRNLIHRFAVSYEEGVRAELNRIGGRKSGAALLRDMDRHPSWTRIVPYLPTGRDWMNGSNMPHYIVLATREGLTVRTEAHSELNGPFPSGRGLGSDSTLEFITPDLARLLPTKGEVARPFEKPDPSTLAQPDELLVHELTHALRAQAGVTDRRPVPHQKLYGSVDEFCAFLVANIYRSEKGLKGIRNDNHGEFALVHMTDVEFLNLLNNRALLRQFRRDHRQLTRDLVAIDCAFNPLRRLEEEEAAANERNRPRRRRAG